jgi:predicted transcriptional regulator
MTPQRDDNRALARRQELGLKLTDVASRAKRSAALISNIEHGYVPSKLSTMVAVAEALETTPLVLWPDEVEADV